MNVPLRPDEYEVCEILLQLPRLIAESESRQKFPIHWGAKRRRSTPCPPLNHSLVSSPSPQFLHQSAAVVQTEEDTSPTAAVADAPSPSTPFSFEKPKRSNSNSKCPLKWLEMIDESTRRRELLLTEVENMKSRYERLKAFNIELIARKQELSLGLRREETHLAVENFNPPAESRRPMSQPPAEDNQENQRHIPIINLHQSPVTDDQTCQRSQTMKNFQNPSTSLVNVVNDDVSRRGIPDLNVSPAEKIWMDHCEALGVSGFGR